MASECIQLTNACTCLDLSVYCQCTMANCVCKLYMCMDTRTGMPALCDSSTSVRLNACIKLEHWHGKLLTSNETFNHEGVSAMSNER